MFSILIRRKEYYRIPISILIILTFSQIALAESTGRLTLSDAVQIALKNNREIAILQKDIEKARGEKRAASRILQDNPEIAGEVENRRSGNQNFTDFGFSLSQPIEIGRQRHYRMGIAELNLLKAQLQLERERLAVTEKIKMVFIDLTALNEKFQAVQNILAVEQDLLQWISIRSAHGEISSVALHTVKLELLETKEKLLDLQRAIIAKKRELEWVMNAPISEDMEIVYSWPGFPTKIELDKLQKYAEKHNPDIKISLADLKKAEASVKLTKAGRIIPYLKLSLNYSREENYNLIGPGLSIPLPLFNRKTGEINAARAEQEKAALELQRIREKLLSELNNSYESLAIMERQKKLFAEQILPITQQNLDEIKMRYQTGEFGLMTLERFWDNWMEAKINYADFLQEYYHTLCQIELLLGMELKEAVKKNQPEE